MKMGSIPIINTFFAKLTNHDERIPSSILTDSNSLIEKVELINKFPIKINYIITILLW
ncbi:hypothetical protein EMIT0P218_440003 [Pseudomonas sp. IT-P218]